MGKFSSIYLDECLNENIILKLYMSVFDNREQCICMLIILLYKCANVCVRAGTESNF